ncbi:class I SAM-dependent methyltransferase [Caenibacillus caldisaponilyticus]|uniref:class I SAM-dependent methyltransferase n=1 Tax=Caenibacillus caldisaponilyticus TaxID=1674942 RepID=UPI001EE7478D|nr:class I SAM-dependent methyltransferase [Caenibacillus caldisaponilyticus]
MRKFPAETFDALVDFFDRMAQTAWLAALHRRLVSLTGDWGGKCVLDVGCGTGRLLLCGAAKTARMVGVDLSEKMVEKSRENARMAGFADTTAFYVGDAVSLPFEASAFDLVLSACVMFLLPEPEKGMREMLRVAKTKGQIAMLNPGERMTEEAAAAYIERHQLAAFEKEALQQWAKVAVRRHRYSESGLTALLNRMGAEGVIHYPAMDGLALITLAYKA